MLRCIVMKPATAIIMNQMFNITVTKISLVKNGPKLSLFKKYSPHICVLQRLFSQNFDIEKIVVDYDYVNKATSNKNTLIIDVREPHEIKEHGRIPNSINIPLGNIATALGSISEKQFENLYKRPKPAEDSEIIFYCMIGKRSGMAQHNAFNLGYTNVKNYLGSWIDWKNKSINKLL